MEAKPSETVTLPAHYYAYKGNFKRCAAIQIVFEYFDIKELIKVQQLSRRFYTYICPGICPKVQLPKQVGFTEQMKQQVTRVMLFGKHPSFYTFSASTGFQWQSKPLVVEGETDCSSCPTEWPKNCQISKNEWLFFGGGNLDQTDERRLQEGTQLVTKLNTVTQRLTKLSTEIPVKMCAHQVIYLPETSEATQGTVYVFGGLSTMSHYQPKNFKYDIADNQWTELPYWQHVDYRLSFNLLPLISNRFILTVCENQNKLFDTKTSKFISLKQKGHMALSGVQIGAFTLPIGAKVENRPKSSNSKNSRNSKEQKSGGASNKSYDSSMEKYSDYNSGEDENMLDELDDDEEDWEDEQDSDQLENTEENCTEQKASQNQSAQAAQKEEETKDQLISKMVYTDDDLIKLKSESRLIEMIWFGGINSEVSDAVFLVKLRLDHHSQEQKTTSNEIEVKGGTLIIKRLRNKAGKFAKLLTPDRFFYNQEFYMHEPTQMMEEKGFGYQGKYTSRWFNKNRYIGVVGREAFHVFDLERMDFVCSDPSKGYKSNIDSKLYQE